MIVLSRIAFVLIAVGMIACNDGDEEKFEKISKLRALGVAAAPIGLTPSTDLSAQTATMTFFVAAPRGSIVQYEPYQDERARYAVPINLAVDTSTEKVAEYAKFSIHQVNAVFGVPSENLIPIPANPGFARIRYGLRVRSGGEEEIVVGTLVLYPTSEARPNYEPLTVTIDSPLATDVVGNQTALEATVENKNTESVKIGWFVSSGTVKNRRARSTEWQDVESGPQTVVVTARGMKSGAFAYAVHDLVRQ